MTDHPANGSWDAITASILAQSAEHRDQYRAETTLADRPPADRAEQATRARQKLTVLADHRAQTEPPEPAEVPPVSSWAPVDFTAVLDGSWQPPQPTVGRRADGIGLFYPGRRHSIVAESEGGKTWFALGACLDEARQGHNVVYLDFEDDAGGVIGRLVAMGATASALEHFTYIRPEERVQAHWEALSALLRDLQPSLVVLDGVTEAMVLQGLNPLDNVDVVKFSSVLIKPLGATGAAVVMLDHVVKDREGRGRYAIGGVHKLNGISGAQYVLENRQPFGIGLRGISYVRIAKDRPGQLRKQGLPGKEGLSWFADLVVDARGDISEVTLEAPHERDDSWRPTKLMQRISDAMTGLSQPMAQRGILDLVPGNQGQKAQAFAQLIADGHVSAKTPHSLLKPYLAPRS